MIHSYPSIYNLGHRAIADLTKQPVYVEEKVDGSQFSFGVVEVDGKLELQCRSKGAQLYLEAPQKMFEAGVATAKKLFEAGLLNTGWTYRGEYLAKPKHNVLAYERVPNQHIIIFDINPGLEQYLSYEEKLAEATRLGLECVKLLYSGMIESVDKFRELLAQQSVLGGQDIEGVVIKPQQYNLFGADKKCLLGKYVSEAFKEIHQVEWRKENPTSKDIIVAIGDQFRTPARWNKAIQHLRELGQIEDSPRDIGKIIKEIPADVLKECQLEIQAELWKWAWPHIQRGLITGFPQWYKDQLVAKQFEV